MKSAPFFIPALIIFPGVVARQDAWGRLLELNAGGAVLCTGAWLAKGDELSVGFELGGEKLTIPAQVHHSEYDDDSYCRAELRWTGIIERRTLARVLVDVLARA